MTGKYVDVPKKLAPSSPIKVSGLAITIGFHVPAGTVRTLPGTAWSIQGW